MYDRDTLDLWLKSTKNIYNKDQHENYIRRYRYLSKNLDSVPVDASIDLHYLTVSEARVMLEEFLVECMKLKDCVARIVHGMGKRSQDKPRIKHFVREWCQANTRNCIKMYRAGAQHNGGAGVMIVWIYVAELL